MFNYAIKHVQLKTIQYSHMSVALELKLNYS